MIVFFYDNNQIVCILLLWMLLGGIGVPMATVSAQDVSTDSTGRAVKLNQVVISKRDMRMIVLRPTGDTLAVFRIACGRNYGHKQREWDCRTPEARAAWASSGGTVLPWASSVFWEQERSLVSSSSVKMACFILSSSGSIRRDKELPPIILLGRYGTGV